MTASALLRYTRPIDGTIPVTALLYNDEHLLASQDGVGLYDGPSKSPAHQAGSIHVTSHRLFYISGASSASPLHAPSPADERNTSLFLDLCHVSRTESYAGFLTSSPKVTLHLRTKDVANQSYRQESLRERFDAGISTASEGRCASPSRPSVSLHDADDTFDIWECEICGYRNPPGLSPAARSACGLCGMPRTVSAAASSKSSTSLPDSVKSVNVSAAKEINANFYQGSRLSSVRSTTPHLSSKSLPSSTTHTPQQSSSNLISRDSLNVPNMTAHTNQRGRKRKPSAIACPACTFLNYPSLRECEICGSELPRLPGDDISQEEYGTDLDYHSKSAPSTRPTSPGAGAMDSFQSLDIEEGMNYIKISFRKGGDKAFYSALKTALQKKEWEIRGHSWSAKWPIATGFSGISGIMQNIDTTVIHTERGMSDAFGDLEALMSKAQEMVRLARGLNEQLALAAHEAGEEPLEPEEATFVRSSLGQLGLGMKASAVTPDMSRDEKKYLEQLAMELAGVLLGNSDDARERREGAVGKGIMQQRGIIGLDEVWGGWNRARGVSLISPEVTLKVLPFLPSHTTPPIHTRILSSGLRVLHTPAYSISTFSARLVALLSETGPCTTTEIAASESLSVGLVEELVAEAEQGGTICLDDPMGGAGAKTGAGAGAGVGVGFEARWWVNMFDGYVWDGQVDQI